MLRRFCKNLERYCLVIFSVSIVVGAIIYGTCVICCGIIDHSSMDHDKIVVLSLSGIGMSLISSMITFGFFGRQIRMFVITLDDLEYRMREWKDGILGGIYEWRVKRSKDGKVSKNKLIDWLEDSDMKVYDVKTGRGTKVYSMQRIFFKG